MWVSLKYFLYQYERPIYDTKFKEEKETSEDSVGWYFLMQ